MRARVRKRRTADRAPTQVERAAGTEVRNDEGQGGDTPPWPALVASTIPKGATVHSPFADSGAPFLMEALSKADGSVTVLDAPEFDDDPAVQVALSKFARNDVLLGNVDSPEVRSAWADAGLSVFKVTGADEHLFAASYDLPDVAWLTKLDKTGLQPEQGDELVAQTSASVPVIEKMSKREVTLVKSDDDDAERVVYGIVLEPDDVDAQNDTISADEIYQAAHTFMEEYGNVGLQHQTFINGKARILESFIAPDDLVIGDQAVKKGTWIMAMRVLDDNIWAAVKSGLIGGFSIGGSAIRVPA